MHITFSDVRGSDVRIETGLLETTNRALADAVGCRRGLVVLDAGLESQYGQRLRRYVSTHLAGVSVLSLPLSEETKTMETVLEVCHAAERSRLGRRDPLVAVGGGLCCDIVSVAAALIRRGVPYLTVPTTLLAQIDAGIALKGGVNFDGHKNYLGCFRPPMRVLVDLGFLETVETAELRSGIAELLKIALVRDADLFRLLRRHGRALLQSHFLEPGEVARTLVERAIRLMLEELAANPYEEQSLERLADFGHTFSGRLEEVSGYQLRHGEAVAIDIALSAALAAELGMLRSSEVEEILTTLVDLGLPTSSPLLTDAMLQEAMHATVAHRGGSLNLVVPTAIGEGAFVRSRSDVPDLALVRARRRIRTLDSSRPHGFRDTRDDRAWAAGDPPTVRRSRG